MMPAFDQFVGERCVKVLEEVEHEGGNPTLRGRSLGTLSGLQTEVSADGGLHTFAIKDFALDGRGLKRFLADQAYLEGFSIMLAQVLHYAKQLTTGLQEAFLERTNGLGIENEIRPVGKLPVPSHELLQ